MDRLSQVTSHLTYPNGLLHNQTTIITGGGQGIGAEIARLFANEGGKVVIADIDSGMSFFRIMYYYSDKGKLANFVQKKQHPRRNRSRRTAAKPSPWSAISWMTSTSRNW